MSDKRDATGKNTEQTKIIGKRKRCHVTDGLTEQGMDELDFVSL